jgi:hypothetical protein
VAGKGTISVNQTPNYGDKNKLENLNKNLTKTPMSGVPTPAPAAGRPVSTGAGQQQHKQPAQPQQDIDPAQQSRMAELAEAYRTHQFWQGVLAQYPSDWSRIYAKEAERDFQKKQVELRNSTPFFE